MAQVRIYHTALQREFETDVGGWTRSLNHGVVRRATATAPRRGGYKTEYLAQRHRGWVTNRGPYGRNSIVVNDASYSFYVHDGTAGNGSGWIEPKRGPFLIFPGSEVRLPRGLVFMRRVRGQKGQPWLRDALQDELVSRGIYKRVTDVVGDF